VRLTDATACLIAAGPPGAEIIRASCGAVTSGSPLPRDTDVPRFATGGPRKPVIVRDALKARKHRDTVPAAVYGLRSWVLVPLRAHNGRHCGVIVIGDEAPRKWRDEEVRRVEEVAERAARELEVRTLSRRQQRVARALRAARRKLRAFRGLLELAGEDDADLFWIVDGQVRFAVPRSSPACAGLLETTTYAQLMRQLADGDVGSILLGTNGGSDASRREVRIAAVRGPGPMGLIGCARSLAPDSERVAELEQAVRDREERMRLVERATADLTWDWDLVSNRIHWSAGGADRLRYRPDVVDPDPAWHAAHVHPEDRDRVVAGLRSAIQGASDSWADEYRFMRGDGSYATVMDRALVVRDGEGRAIRVLGWKTDISERTRAEAGQRFLARASALLDSALDVRMTLQNLARVCVPHIADMAMVDLIEPDGSATRAAVAHADPARESELEPNRVTNVTGSPGDPLGVVLHTGEPVLMSTIAPDAADPLLNSERLDRLGVRSLVIVPIAAHERVLGAITLATSASGRTFDYGDLGIARDLARRAGLALENARLYEKAQDAIRAREEVLRIVSHDLRDPLNTIVMSTTVLGDASPERRAEVKRMLNTIQRAADQMDSLISDLLDTTNMGRGGFTLDPADHTVGALLEDVRDLFEPLAEGKDIRLVLERPADLPLLRVDQRQMTRVLSNLVGNALKFTPEGGTVTIRAIHADGEVWFEVRDTGRGIPAEHLDRVFERFWQADQSDRRGAGLGLAIAKGIVEAHGGRIWVESRVGEGSSFFVALPTPESSPLVLQPRSIVRRAPGEVAPANVSHPSAV